MLLIKIHRTVARVSQLFDKLLHSMQILLLDRVQPRSIIVFFFFFLKNCGFVSELVLAVSDGDKKLVQVANKVISIIYRSK